MGAEHQSHEKPWVPGAYRGELSGTRSGRFTSTTPNFREVPKKGTSMGVHPLPQDSEPRAGGQNFLQRGTKVRMLTDHISLKKGEIGEVTDVVAWVGRTGCLVELTFRDGMPRFTQDAKNLLNLVEVVK